MQSHPHNGEEPELCSWGTGVAAFLVQASSLCACSGNSIGTFVVTQDTGVWVVAGVGVAAGVGVGVLHRSHLVLLPTCWSGSH